MMCADARLGACSSVDASRPAYHSARCAKRSRLALLATMLQFSALVATPTVLFPTVRPAAAQGVSQPGTLRPSPVEGSPAGADGARNALRHGGGLRLEGALSYGRPMLDEHERSVWQQVGRFDAGAGVVLGLGYDWSRFGLSLVMDAANSPVGSRHGNNLSFAALTHWLPDVALGGGDAAWRLRLSAGYVRQGLSGTGVMRSELPAALAARVGPIPTEGTPVGHMGLLGNGFRLGVAAERPLTANFAARIGTSLDAVWFGTVTYEGRDYSLQSSSRGVLPRAAITLVWRPF